MFSYSQPATVTSGTLNTPLQEEGDEDLEEEIDEDEPADIERSDSAANIEQLDHLSLYPARPRLQEALEKSASKKNAQTTQELQAPELSSITSKKQGTEYKSSYSIPLDWTLRTSISISSPDTLAWCDQGSPIDEIKALHHFVSKPRSLQTNNTSSSNKSGSERGNDNTTPTRVLLLAATYHWIYPPNNPTIPQAQSISKLLKNTGNMSSGEKNGISDMFSRSTEWKQAFKALYQSFRNGACPYFYYVGTTWTILFLHGTTSLSGDLEAILTNSTPGLRKVLQEEDIKFERLPDVTRKTTIHNLSSKRDLENFDDNDPDTTKEPNVTTATASQMDDRDLSDALLFKGLVSVHGLFGYLLNLKTSYEDGFLYQSPTLIADVPFLHGALKRAQISKCRVVSKHIEGTDKMQREFRVDIHGTLLPTSTRELCNIFANQYRQSTGYTYVAASDPRSFGLNLRPLLAARELTSESTTSPSPYISPKAMDQMRYNHATKQFTWLS
ncbi:hypothetical protein BC939DRAFT_319251 [Gamsiella multidivaricata]|uniref:uncharacterized protein n=1 Tax=Gamsiella multidivaricata TaxID=101098 RepID=UPI00221E3AAE|nr:uncharacterized protein BC939DRAFT_319251 [Gamsiella multidivaricata]KAI7817630.1 hypothetical protein BC939DRAFT_319251 [Gamsiella multidivaricata]